MNRRTLLQAVGATGSLVVAGCLETDAGVTEDPEANGGPVRYGRPAHSSWPPARSHDNGSVVSYHLELSSLPAIRRAVSTGRLDSTNPLVGLPLSGVDRISAAVESLSSYPFGTALRQAVNAAGRVDDEYADENATVVDPSTEPIRPENESAADQRNETEIDTNSTATADNANSTETADEHSTNESNVTAGTDDQSAGSELESEPESVTAADVGIEVDAVMLTDGLLVFEGSFDHSEIVDRFGWEFEQVDSQRGVSIYEGHSDAAGLAFGLTGTRLFVPTEDPNRAADGRRVLAHVLSGYISTLNRIVDEDDGQWLFETTGEGALSVCIWEQPDTVEFLTDTGVMVELSSEYEAIFGPLSSCISTLSVTADSQRLTAAEARFSGLFPADPPAEEELQSTLVVDADPETVFSEPPRAHVTATFSSL